jgi:divalent metal cation (Fe/Co/Zn/Cd) transporter
MDKSPSGDLLDRISAAALATADVRSIEKLMVRKAGLNYFVDLHVQAEPSMSLHDAHVLSGRVKTAIRQAVPEVAAVLIHMEPYEM